MDGCRSELFLRTGERAYWVDRINGTISMSRKAPRLALRESQTACLVALRHRKCSTPRLAIEAKLDIKKTTAALRTLTRLGLAEREGTRTWRTTARGATCRFETGPDRPRRTQEPGPSSQCLLDLLDRPMTSSVIAEKLRGHTSESSTADRSSSRAGTDRILDGDPDDPFWIVMQEQRTRVSSCLNTMRSACCRLSREGALPTPRG